MMQSLLSCAFLRIFQNFVECWQTATFGILLKIKIAAPDKFSEAAICISFRIGVLKVFALITGEHLCWSLFLIKLQTWRLFPVNITKFLWTAFFTEHSGGCFWIIWVYNIHARFTHLLMLELLFTFFDWKTSKWAYHLLQFFISYQEKFLKLIQLFPTLFMVQVFQGPSPGPGSRF